MDKNNQKRKHAKQVRRVERRWKRVRSVLISASMLMLLAAAVFLIQPFTHQSPGPLSDRAVVAPVDAEGRPMYTPVPTPTPKPTPTPSPTPSPTPRPTPTPKPTPMPQSRTIDPTKKMVALTYDDGPYGKVTGELLSILADNDAKATFFVVGSRANDYPDVVKAVADAGHQLGSHTQNHKILTKATDAQVKSEMKQSLDAIEKASGVRPHIMRPPGGAFDDRVQALVGMPLINWSVDTLDWKTRNADKVVAEIKENTFDGSIILMHDLYGTTAEASKKVIPWLIKQGYQLVTIDELFQYRGPSLKDGEVYRQASKLEK